MRIGHRHAQRRPLAHPGDRHLRVVSGVAARQTVFAHVDRVDGAVERNRLDAAAGCDVHGPACLEVDHALDPQVVHEHSQAVAAHLRDGAVGVAVVHEPFRFGKVPGDVGRLGNRGGAHNAYEPVRADAEMAVAYRSDGLGRQIERACEVRHKNEVVAGAVCLREGPALELRNDHGYTLPTLASALSAGTSPWTRPTPFRPLAHAA